MLVASSANQPSSTNFNSKNRGSCTDDEETEHTQKKERRNSIARCSSSPRGEARETVERKRIEVGDDDGEYPSYLPDLRCMHHPLGAETLNPEKRMMGAPRSGCLPPTTSTQAGADCYLSPS